MTPGKLTWDDMTSAEQITLPTYPVVALVAGLLYALQPATRLSGPAFQTARDVLSMDQWGAIFAAVGACQLVALVLGAYHGSRWLYVQTLKVGVALTAFWAVLLFLSARESPFVSYTSSLWLVALTVLQMATTRGLRRRGREHA